jgi:nucleoside-triphosphatase THEP1
MNKFSELKIIFSNCLSGGTGWNTVDSELIENLYKEMVNVNGLEFKKINSNTVRGEHNSFTIVLSGVFYNLIIEKDSNLISKLLEYVRNAANRIAGFTYSEIRIEHTRHLSIFNDLEHKILSKMV